MVLGVLIASGITVVSSPKAISLMLRNPICAEPCTVAAVISVDKEQIKNGEPMCFALQDDFPEPSRISCWPYNGERILEVRVKDIPAGIYRVQVATRQHRDHARLEVH